MNHYRSPTTGSPKRIGKTNTPYVLGVLVLPVCLQPHCFRLASLAENAIHQESSAVGCLPCMLPTLDVVYLGGRLSYVLSLSLSFISRIA
ncbi:MAG: hypothetical protein LBQ66_04245 [Planctomycetaceae bacterium]|nr:hypothetical protein [Planctomycetaceae bacterium]